MSLLETVKLTCDGLSDKQPFDDQPGKAQPDLDTLFAQIKAIAAGADNAGRIKVLDGLRDLSYSIETADDTAKRLLYSVSGSAFSKP